MTDKDTLRTVLACPMLPNDALVDTVGEYLKALAQGVWYEGEGFSGKRPFGDSGWDYHVFHSLAAAGLVPSTSTTYDDEDYTEYELENEVAAHSLVQEALQAATLVIR